MDNTQGQTPQQESITPQTQTVAPRKSNTLVIVIGGIVLLGLGLFGGYFLFGNKNQYNTNNDTTTKISSAPMSTPAPSLDTTALNSQDISKLTWKIYTNNTYSVSYPDIFTLVTDPTVNRKINLYPKDDDVIFQGMINKTDNAQILLVVSVNPVDLKGATIHCTSDNECMEKWRKEYSIPTEGNGIGQIERTLLGRKIKGTTMGIPTNSNVTRYDQYYLIYEKGNVYMISYINENDAYPIAETIFNTFLNNFKVN